MKHATGLLIKYLFMAAITTTVLSGFLGAPTSSSLWVALVLTVALYLAGDLIILPIMGNFMATIADAGVALILASLAPIYAAVEVVPFSAALAIAALVGIAEYFFHGFLNREVLPGPVTGERR